MQELYNRITRHLVGRRQESEIILAVILSGRHLLLEGPPGTSKSTILQALVREMRRPIFSVTGNSDLTTAKLLGHFDPSRVLADGYKPEYFQYGPLTRAMLDGAILYVEEFNRLPDDTANVFVGITSEAEISIPHLGTVRAKPEFRVIGALNPHDDTGTLRLSRALRDRFCSIHLDYQSSQEENEIVRMQTGEERLSISKNDDASLVEMAVEICRRTRGHKDIRLGASVRGAIDMVLIARQLRHHLDADLSSEELHRIVFPAALTALRDKVWLNETTSRSPDDVIEEIWQGLAERWQRDGSEGGDLTDVYDLKKKPSEIQSS